jgi:hypothetical protein
MAFLSRTMAADRYVSIFVRVAAAQTASAVLLLPWSGRERSRSARPAMKDKPLR